MLHIYDKNPVPGVTVGAKGAAYVTDKNGNPVWYLAARNNDRWKRLLHRWDAWRIRYCSKHRGGDLYGLRYADATPLTILKNMLRRG